MSENSMMEAVHPVQPPAPYMGGKRHLAKRLIARSGRSTRIETVPHKVYAKPFLGMGGVFAPSGASAITAAQVSAKGRGYQ